MVPLATMASGSSDVRYSFFLGEVGVPSWKYHFVWLIIKAIGIKKNLHAHIKVIWQKKTIAVQPFMYILPYFPDKTVKSIHVYNYMSNLQVVCEVKKIILSPACYLWKKYTFPRLETQVL